MRAMQKALRSTSWKKRGVNKYIGGGKVAHWKGGEA